jgi:hypothetical protein
MRYRSKDGCWTVTPISLSLTGTGRDGDWLRVRYLGSSWNAGLLQQMSEFLQFGPSRR